ncbi:MAG: glycosyl hydrolase 53 family protein [Oscillospiraceae bacterium]|nr:glycosyl hydrolase 53 family protein [Oscillospiraceae bacterium]
MKFKKKYITILATTLALFMIFGVAQAFAVAADVDSPEAAAYPEITTTALPSGNVGSPYRAVLRTHQVGTHHAIEWAVTGNLPAGLSLNPFNGVITGMPTTTGITTFTISATNMDGLDDYVELSITIEAALGAANSEIHTGQLANVHPDFARGADVSSFLSLYNAGVRFYDFDGQEQCMFVTLAEAGFNYVRLRVWVNPYVDIYTDGPGSETRRVTYGGGAIDPDAAIEMGRRAAAAGLYTKVAFHYSDTWADPGKFIVPRAWAHTPGGNNSANTVARTTLLYDHTFDTILRMLEAGVMVRLVGVGNETNPGIAGMTGWGVNGAAMGAFHEGARAVRNAERVFRGYEELPRAYEGGNVRSALPPANCTFVPNILTAKHWANTSPGGNPGMFMAANADFDIYGVSAYPQWGHASGVALTNVLNTVHNTINPASSDRVRHVMIFESSHPTTKISGNMHEVIAPRAGHANLTAPATVQGSANALQMVIQSMNNTDNNPDVIARGGNIGGVFLWEPAWIPEAPGVNNEPGNWAYNFERWEEDGTGWATSYGIVVDPGDAGVMYGGGAHENQNIFDWDGRPLPNIRVFDYVFRGASPADGNAIDIFTIGNAPRTQVSDTHSRLVLDLETISPEALAAALPTTMWAHRMDNSRQSMPITWDVTELNDFYSFLTTIENFGSHTRLITGRTWDDVVEAYAYTARYLTVAPPNLVNSHHFGTPAQAGWDNPAPQVSGTGVGQWNLTRQEGTTTRQVRGRESFMVRSGPFGVGFYRPIPNTFHVAGETNSRSTSGALSFNLSQIINISEEDAGYFNFEAYVGGEVNTTFRVPEAGATYDFAMILRHRDSPADDWVELARTPVQLQGYRVWSNPIIERIEVASGQAQVAFEFRASHGAFGMIDSVYFYRLPEPPPALFNGTNPARLLDLLELGDVVLQTRSNLGIFDHHGPFIVPVGRTLYIETALNIQGDAQLIIEGTVEVLPGGRINNQGGRGGTITIAEGGTLINNGHVENVTNSTLANYGTIENNGRFEVRARVTFYAHGHVTGTNALNVNRDAIVIE